MMKKILLGVMALMMGCLTVTAQKSIVILYENDVHCGIDGYTKMAGLRDAINRTDTAYAAAVCVGDFLQGNTTGAISKGQYIVDIMRLMDYHALTLGNHEFDYGVPRMRALLEQVGTPVVCANFYEAGEPNPVFAPYVIHQYGDKKVAFVGACTPETMILEGYSFYDTNGILLYDLKPKTFYELIQQAVDAARKEGADYVVLLSHVGETPQSMGFSSHRLVNNTRGIDVVLDGHSHEIFEGVMVKNLDGKEIAVTQTGTQFANVGKLLITPDGRMTTHLIKSTDIPYENAAVTAAIDSVHQMVKAVTSEVIAHSDYRLVVSDENARWIVRGQETNAGDLVADAYRYAMKADIGFENGGGIRNDILRMVVASAMTLWLATSPMATSSVCCPTTTPCAALWSQPNSCRQCSPAVQLLCLCSTETSRNVQASASPSTARATPSATSRFFRKTAHTSPSTCSAPTVSP